MDNLIKNAGGLVDLVTILGNKDGIVNSASATITCTQNQTTTVFANRATAQTVQLPAWSDQRFPIYIEKTAANGAVVTIQRAGADTINNPYNSSPTPVPTTFTLRLPGESCWVYPDPVTNFWHVLMVNEPNHLTTAHVYRTFGAQTVTTFGAVASQMQTKLLGSDVMNYYNTSTFRYTPLIAGKYEITTSHNWNSGANATVITSFARNSLAELYRVGHGSGTEFLSQSSKIELQCNGFTDYLNISLTSISANRSVQGTSSTQWAIFKLLNRTA
jgi:hypothetical protein